MFYGAGRNNSRSIALNVQLLFLVHFFKLNLLIKRESYMQFFVFYVYDSFFFVSSKIDLHCIPNSRIRRALLSRVAISILFQRNFRAESLVSRTVRQNLSQIEPLEDRRAIS